MNAIPKNRTAGGARADATRLVGVQTPIIPTVAKLILDNPGTISLGQGVVSYGPPPQAIEAIGAFLQNPQHHKYQPVWGIAPLVAAIEAKLARENAIHVAPESRIVVTAGSNMAFLQVVMAISDPGDEFILPLPYYFNQEMAIHMLGCVPVCVPTTADYQLDIAAIERAITPRTRAVVTVSPNNPSGAVYSRDSLIAVNALAAKHGLFHLSDEAYEYFTYDGAEHFSPGSLPGAAAHTISLYSLSKAYGFASWRIGYMVIPARLFDAMAKIQDTNVICPPVISQFAAQAAIEHGSAYVRDRIAALAQVRRQALDALAPLSDRIALPATQGALYLLARLKQRTDDLALVEKLVRDFKVAVIPGQAFGLSQATYLRISYGALEPATVMEGIGRLAAGLRALS